VFPSGAQIAQLADHLALYGIPVGRWRFVQRRLLVVLFTLPPRLSAM
jgi:hypothetical protein